MRTRANAETCGTLRRVLSAGYIIMVWIALSSGVILQNAYILRTLQ